MIDRLLTRRSRPEPQPDFDQAIDTGRLLTDHIAEVHRKVTRARAAAARAKARRIS